MSYEKAVEIAINKLEWQMLMHYRVGYNDEDIHNYARQVYMLQNTFDGGVCSG
ncbi:Uncharacterised protein [Peptostreptococcus anaerobius]|uniref:Uncharacterized protein n=1 Tax=Peptostreptococcus anaerobius TaxID=1261 RepID=A0A379CH77_9FIRM|nr:hypothetical protein [Peptostreptococcus anaerobius]EKX89318.1 hypothetical protein HMPREF9998_01753 [Peptostreptococcus anaerobius VPI 4330 = DSM 2949]SFM70546.1 hypothetical protein SAMN05660467_00239 [Peptostreptococcus anaerobius]SUB60997.1 Uncharacterised protein [Peptostreptococcus anaerobius]